MRPVTDLVRLNAPFRVEADFAPSGDQPAAIEELEERLRKQEKDLVLLGATGTGKTATVAWLVERLQRPTLVMAPNKTLAAQFANELLRRLVTMQYTRNDLSFTRGTFRVRGDTIEIIPVYHELAVRIEMFGDEIERLSTLHPLTGELLDESDHAFIFPASHYVAGPERMERAIAGIEAKLEERLAE